MDLGTLMRDVIAQNTFPRLALNQFAQFGQPGMEPYMGPTLLPERLVADNEFTETAIRYRTTIANDGDRYSPAQKKGKGGIIGSFRVSLGNSDILTEFTGQDYDTVVRILAPLANANNTIGMAVAAQITNWGNTAINLALIERNELQRWQAIFTGQVVREGDNGLLETVLYPNPVGHRTDVAGDWSDNSYAILTDLLALATLLRSKGYNPTRIITSTAVANLMLANETMARAAGRSIITVGAGAVLTQTPGSFTMDDLNRLLAQNRLPAIETYDKVYFKDDGTSARFFPEDGLVMASTTGRNERVAQIENPNQFRLLTDTLGYVGVGRAVGQVTPGRVIQVTPYTNKPPRLEGEGWQSSLPIITEPEAFAVYTGITLS
jgi:hypothetical protein